MVICIGGSGAGKSLLLSLLRDREFDTDTALVPTVGVNIFKVELRTEGSKRGETIDIRELGGQLAPVWADYIKSVKSVIFVVNSLNLGQAGLVGIKLCECLKILEQTSRDSNQVCKLCLVWTRSGDISPISRLVRLTELLHQSPVVSCQVSLDIGSPGHALDKIRAWLLATL